MTGLFDELMTGDRTGLLARLPARPGPALAPVVAAVRRVAGRGRDLPARRFVRLLALTAAQLGAVDVARQIGAAQGYPPVWAHGFGAPYQELLGHTHRVTGLAFGRLDGHDVLVSLDEFGAKRVWDEHGEPMDGVVDAVVFADPYGRALTDPFRITGWLDGQEVVVEAWPTKVPSLHTPSGKRYDAPATTLVVYDLAGDRVGGPIWDLTPPVSGAVRGRKVVAAVGRWGEQDIVAVVDSHDSRVRGSAETRVVDMSGQPVGLPLVGRAPVIGTLGGRDVIATADGTAVRLWDRYDPPLGVPALHFCLGPLLALAAVQWEGRDALASVDQYGCLSVWEMDGGRIFGPCDFSYTAAHWAADYSEDLADEAQAYGAALGRLGGRHVLATGSDDGQVRVWDLRGDWIVRPVNRYSYREPRTDWPVNVAGDGAIAVGRLGGRDVIISADEHTIHIWDECGDPLGEPLSGFTAEVGHLVVGFNTIVAAAGTQIQVWDPSGNPVDGPPTPHAAEVTSLAAGHLAGRGVFASGSADGTVRIWAAGADPATDGPNGAVPTRHAGPVVALAIGRFGGRDVVASAGDDHTIRLWDPTGGDHDVLDLLAPPSALLLHGDRLFAGVGPALCAWSAA